MAGPAEIPSQHGRSAVVTGATGGLGYETALALAKAGAEVVLTGRDDRKGQSAIEKISREVPEARTSYESLDLASLQSIAEFSQRMQSRQSLDLLINNAGVMALPRRQTTADGFEMQFGTNYLGHFALTIRLLPLLRGASAPRVVNVSSLAHRTAFIDFNDLQGARLYLPWKAYGQSKLATLMFALELQRRSDAAGWNLTSTAAHPGFARTNLFTSGPGGLLSLASDFAAPLFGHSAAEGARPILFAATSPQAKPGAYYGPAGIGELRGAPASAPGREGLFGLVMTLPATLRYENRLAAATGDFVILHGRFSGHGRPAAWVVADIVRMEDGVLAEHWDVIQDEATREQSASGLPMFGDRFPA